MYRSQGCDHVWLPAGTAERSRRGNLVLGNISLCIYEIESHDSKERKDLRKDLKVEWVWGGGFFFPGLFCVPSIFRSHSDLVVSWARQAGDGPCVCIFINMQYTQHFLYAASICIFVFVRVQHWICVYTIYLLLSVSLEARWHIPGPSASLLSSAVCQWIHWQWSCVTSMSWGLSGG